MKLSRLIILGLVKIPLLVTMIIFMVNMKFSQMKFRFFKRTNTSSKKIQEFLKDPHNMFKWLNQTSPILKSIRPAVDARGKYYKLTLGSDDIDVEFRMEFLTISQHSVDGGEVVYQTKYKMESDYLRLTFDHFANEDIEENTSLFTTTVSLGMKGRLFSLAMRLGEMSFGWMMKDAFDNLVHILEERAFDSESEGSSIDL